MLAHQCQYFETSYCTIKFIGSMTNTFCSCLYYCSCPILPAAESLNTLICSNRQTCLVKGTTYTGPTATDASTITTTEL